ncbi:uncharacterized protein LOC117123034, partial [Anneissia japonica]|uniref:uncharacterized protein LOC117123034 n=1 Tax=Anneissia japonica TaxID=1529436 RepID=UPI00142587BE
SDIHELTSIQCIEKGLHLSPDNEIVMRRVASELSLVGCHERAKELFEKSLAKEKSWFAYRHQGLMYLRRYEAGERDQEILLKAEDSFLQAIKMKNVHADQSDLGYVYFLKGPDHWHKALKQFHLAKKNTQNDNFDTTETHRRWARCLEKCGENESANRQWSIAAEMKEKIRSMITTGKRRHGTNCDGSQCELCRFEYCKEERGGFVNVLFENDTPCKSKMCMAQEHTRKPFRYDFFISFCHIDHKWAVALLKKIEKDFNLNGCLRYRDYRLGISIMENIIKSLETSHKTIVILSPDSLKDKWCNFEIQRAVHENVHRNKDRKCIVPLVLRPCDIPVELQDLCNLKCERGQIHDNDWVRLGMELAQDNL